MSEKRKPGDSGVISLAGLKSMGWTPKRIEEILGQPDYLAANPHYTSRGAPMRLYRMDRVEKAEGPEPLADIDSCYRAYDPIYIGRTSPKDFMRKEDAEALYAGGKSPDEVAETLGVSVRTAKRYWRESK